MTLINPAVAADFDPSTALATFQREGHVRLAGIMAPEQADAVSAALDAKTDWTLTCATEAGTARINAADIATWDEAKRAELSAALMAAARKGLGFSYLSALLAAGNTDRLAQFADGLMDATTLDFIGKVTGMNGLASATSQATRYGPGHYLTRHTDAPQDETRQLAFVWGFTRPWHPDWGGLLQFYMPDGTPERTYAPGFNTLDLFSVNKIHAVSFIAPYAGAPRHAISGWYMG